MKTVFLRNRRREEGHGQCVMSSIVDLFMTLCVAVSCDLLEHDVQDEIFWSFFVYIEFDHFNVSQLTYTHSHHSLARFPIHSQLKINAKTHFPFLFNLSIHFNSNWFRSKTRPNRFIQIDNKQMRKCRWLHNCLRVYAHSTTHWFVESSTKIQRNINIFPFYLSLPRKRHTRLRYSQTVFLSCALSFSVYQL